MVIFHSYGDVFQRVIPSIFPNRPLLLRNTPGEPQDTGGAAHVVQWLLTFGSMVTIRKIQQSDPTHIYIYIL